MREVVAFVNTNILALNRLLYSEIVSALFTDSSFAIRASLAQNSEIALLSVKRSRVEIG